MQCIFESFDIVKKKKKKNKTIFGNENGSSDIKRFSEGPRGSGF